MKSASHEATQFPAGIERRNVFRRLIEDALPGFQRRPGDMGSEDQIRHVATEQRIRLWRRLGRENVDPGTRDLAGTQSIGQGLVVYQGAAGRIN